jgi:phytoene dehydrogenase-like protein
MCWKAPVRYLCPIFYLTFLGLCDALVGIHKNSYDYTVAVVGGGVGGLATAARIKAEADAKVSNSVKVVLIEKNSSKMAGGRCGSFYVQNDKGMFRHERGPSLLLLKDVYLELFSDCGKSAEDFGLKMVQCKPAYQVVFEDGESIMLGFPENEDKKLWAMEKMSRDRMDAFEVNGASKWDEYMQNTQAFLDCGLPNFIEERLDLQSFPSFIKESLKDGLKVRKGMSISKNYF